MEPVLSPTKWLSTSQTYTNKEAISTPKGRYLSVFMRIVSFFVRQWNSLCSFRKLNRRSVESINGYGNKSHSLAVYARNRYAQDDKRFEYEFIGECVGRALKNKEVTSEMIVIANLFNITFTDLVSYLNEIANLNLDEYSGSLITTKEQQKASEVATHIDNLFDKDSDVYDSRHFPLMPIDKCYKGLLDLAKESRMNDEKGAELSAYQCLLQLIMGGESADINLCKEIEAVLGIASSESDSLQRSVSDSLQRSVSDSLQRSVSDSLQRSVSD